jgi:hypothetical protein
MIVTLRELRAAKLPAKPTKADADAVAAVRNTIRAHAGAAGGVTVYVPPAVAKLLPPRPAVAPPAAPQMPADDADAAADPLEAEPVTGEPEMLPPAE